METFARISDQVGTGNYYSWPWAGDNFELDSPASEDDLINSRNALPFDMPSILSGLPGFLYSVPHQDFQHQAANLNPMEFQEGSLPTSPDSMLTPETETQMDLNCNAMARTQAYPSTEYHYSQGEELLSPRSTRAEFFQGTQGSLYPPSASVQVGSQGDYTSPEALSANVPTYPVSPIIPLTRHNSHSGPWSAVQRRTQDSPPAAAVLWGPQTAGRSPSYQAEPSPTISNHSCSSPFAASGPAMLRQGSGNTDFQIDSHLSIPLLTENPMDPGGTLDNALDISAPLANSSQGAEHIYTGSFPETTVGTQFWNEPHQPVRPPAVRPLIQPEDSRFDAGFQHVMNPWEGYESSPASEARTYNFVNDGQIDYSSKHTTSQRPRNNNQKASHGMSGGRQLGKKLNPDVAQKASTMRKEGACWICALQRDSCSADDVCRRCRKRASRLNIDPSSICVRTKLSDLRDHFLPSFMTSIHKQEVLEKMANQHIYGWGNEAINLKLVCGRALPHLLCEVYEFTPADRTLLEQEICFTNPETGQKDRRIRRSPPLGMMQLERSDKKFYESYLNKIVDGYFFEFADMFFGAERNPFPKSLLLLIYRLKLTDKAEVKILKSVFRLLVVTYIMSHQLTIMEDREKEAALRRMHSYQPGLYERFCTPRLAVRQLKYLFCTLHMEIMADCLKQLQQILKSSTGSFRWVAAFCTLIGLAFVHEENQKTIYLTMHYKLTEGELDYMTLHSQAQTACQAIDHHFSFLIHLFKTKYNKFNPFKNVEDCTARLPDHHLISFVRKVQQLIWHYGGYLRERNGVDPVFNKQSSFTCRLVAQFLQTF